MVVLSLQLVFCGYGGYSSSAFSFTLGGKGQGRAEHFELLRLNEEFGDRSGAWGWGLSPWEQRKVDECCQNKAPGDAAAFSPGDPISHVQRKCRRTRPLAHITPPPLAVRLGAVL